MVVVLDYVGCKCWEMGGGVDQYNKSSSAI